MTRRFHMEILLVIALGAVVVWWGYTQFNKTKPNGSHPLDSVTKQPEAPYKIEAPVVETQPAPVVEAAPAPATNPLDVNNDGKVNLEDAKEVVKRGRAKAKAKVQEVKAEVKKRTGRKPSKKA